MVFHSMIRTFGTCFEDMFVWRGVPQSEVFLTKDRPHLVVAVAWCLGDMADLVPHWTDHHPHALLQVVSWLHPANLSSLGKGIVTHLLFLYISINRAKVHRCDLEKFACLKHCLTFLNQWPPFVFLFEKSTDPPFFRKKLTTGSWVTGSLIIYPGLVQPCTLARRYGYCPTTLVERWFIWVVATQICCIFTRIYGEMLQFGLICFSNGLKPPHLVIYWLCCCTVESLNICGCVRTR